MKRTVLTSILGIVASMGAVISSYGQGSILFANYGSTTYAPVTYALGDVPEGKAGLLVGSEFTASLYYGIGTITDPVQLAYAGVDAIFGVPPLGPPVADGAPGSGFFTGPLVSIPSYSSGPVTFMVTAWKNSGPYGGTSYANSLLSGASPLFTLSDLPIGPIELGPGLKPFAVSFIPEPSTIALVGLGVVALLVVRKFGLL